MLAAMIRSGRFPTPFAAESRVCDPWRLEAATPFYSKNGGLTERLPETQKKTGRRIGQAAWNGRIDASLESTPPDRGFIHKISDCGIFQSMKIPGGCVKRAKTRSIKPLPSIRIRLSVRRAVLVTAMGTRSVPALVRSSSMRDCLRFIR
ncbi:MAG TPA: hypothetical protein VLO11_10580 [Luteolibacter sp.]|nr:hypothetical protein [Luteolibacter sp.]